MAYATFTHVRCRCPSSHPSCLAIHLPKPCASSEVPLRPAPDLGNLIHVYQIPRHKSTDGSVRARYDKLSSSWRVGGRVDKKSGSHDQPLLYHNLFPRMSSQPMTDPRHIKAPSQDRAATHFYQRAGPAFRCLLHSTEPPRYD